MCTHTEYEYLEYENFCGVQISHEYLECGYICAEYEHLQNMSIENIGIFDVYA